jgi:4-aminobutyrate aminotransferase-like enzyme
MNTPHQENLIAEDLAKDPRIAQAKALILDAVQAHQQNLTTVRPPLSSRKQKYQETLTEFAGYRGGNLWFPYLGSGIGNGSLVELADGSVKYDFICGIGTHYWGHSHPKIIDACINAAFGDVVMQGHLQHCFV